MKKTKAKTAKTGVTGNWEWPKPIATPRRKMLEKLQHELHAQEYPTVLQLAQLAAKFADKKNLKKPGVEEDNFQYRVALVEHVFSCVDFAFEFWDCARARIRSKLKSDLSKEGRPTIFDFSDTDKDGNVIPEKFFKKVLPPHLKSRSYETAKISKAFIRHCIWGEYIAAWDSNWQCEHAGSGLKSPEPPEAEFAVLYEANHKQWTPGDREQASSAADFFKYWYDRYYIRETRRAAGLKSAANKKLKKSL